MSAAEPRVAERGHLSPPTRVPGPRTGVSTIRLTPLALGTVLMGVLLPTVDFFVVNVTLPSMAADLHASDGLLELVLASYATSYAVLLVLGGRIGDARGRRKAFLLGLAGFTVTSLLCGLAPSAWTLVLARTLQGAAAALLVPQTLGTVQATGDASSRARAVGLLGAVGGLGAVLGQVLGGALVSADLGGSGWRPVFLVNVPIGVAGIWLAARVLPDTRAPRAAAPDVAGTVLLALALVSLLLPLTEGRATGWPLWSWLLLAACPLPSAAFAVVEVRSERSGRSPLVPPSLLRQRGMRRGLLLVVLLSAPFGAFMFVYAVLAQSALGFSPLRAGVTLAPMATCYLLASLRMPGLVSRHGGRVLVAGAGLQLLGLAALAGTLTAAWPHVGGWHFLPGLVLMGSGQGLMMPASMRLVLASVPSSAAGSGSGVLSTAQQVALATGVATLGSAFLTLLPPDHLGPLGAFRVILAAQAVTAVVVAGLARRLPRGL